MPRDRIGSPENKTLRIALLAMTETAETGSELPRAFLTVGGRTVAHHQLDLALALEARRIICLTRGTSPELTALKAQAEEGGAQFHAVEEPPALAALIGATDELLVFADGLLAEPRAAIELLAANDVVTVQPADTAMPVGFERLDLNRATGGIVRIPGKLIERLAELPADYDVPSALTRIALHAGIPMREVPEYARRDGRWRLVRSEAEAQALDIAWIALSLGDDRGATPCEALARFGIRSFGSSLLHAGSNSRILALGAAILLLIAVGAGLLGATVVGYGFIALTAVVGQGGLLLMRVEQGSPEPRATTETLTLMLGGLIDAVIVALAVWSAPRFPSATLIGRGFAPLMLIAMLRLTPYLYERRYARWLEDRSILAIILAASAAIGSLTAGVETVALVIAVGALLHLGPGSGARSRSR